MPDLPPRRRSARPSWTQPITDRLTPTIKALVIANAFAYATYVFIREARPFIEAHLALGPRFFSGEIWQPLTSLFVHFDLISFIFNLIGIWFVGATLEQTQGTRRFLALFLGAGVLANLAIIGISRLRPFHAGDVFAGSSEAILALFVATGRIFGRAPTQVLGGLVLQARTLAAIFVGFFAFMALVRGDWAQLGGTIVATLVGYFGAAPGGWSEAWTAFKTRRARRRYRVIEGGAKRPPKKYLN